MYVCKTERILTVYCTFMQQLYSQACFCLQAV